MRTVISFANVFKHIREKNKKQRCEYVYTEPRSRIKKPEQEESEQKSKSDSNKKNSFTNHCLTYSKKWRSRIR